MECRLFIVGRAGDLFCSKPPRTRLKVGTVDDVPAGLSDDQLFQIRTWKTFAPLAHSVAPIFSVTTYDPQHIEAEARFRVPVEAAETGEWLEASLRELEEDLRAEGHSTALDLTALFGAGGEEMKVWKLALLADPTKEDPSALRPGLELVAEAVRTTRIGDHLMDPADEWPPRRKESLGAEGGSARTMLYDATRALLVNQAQDYAARQVMLEVMQRHLGLHNRLIKEGAEPFVLVSTEQVCAWIFKANAGVDSCDRAMRAPETHELWFSQPFDMPVTPPSDVVDEQLQSVFKFLVEMQGRALDHRDKSSVRRRLGRDVRVKGSFAVYLNKEFPRLYPGRDPQEWHFQ